MKVRFVDGKEISDMLLNEVSNKLLFKLPKDFLDIIKNNDGAYLSPNNIGEGDNANIVNNLVSFYKDDPSYILDIIDDLELNSKGIIPIAEDPFGNIFGIKNNVGETFIVFYDSELEKYNKISNSFTDFLNKIY